MWRKLCTGNRRTVCRRTGTSGICGASPRWRCARAPASRRGAWYLLPGVRRTLCLDHPCRQLPHLRRNSRCFSAPRRRCRQHPVCWRWVQIGSVSRALPSDVQARKPVLRHIVLQPTKSKRPENIRGVLRSIKSLSIPVVGIFIGSLDFCDPSNINF